MADESRTANDYCFLDKRYAPDRRLLSDPDGEVRLKPLLDRLLRRLMDDPGSVLMREQLITQVWTRREVNDEVLSRAIAELRSLLGDDARNPRFIETLSKGGYRWIPATSRQERHGDQGLASSSGALVPDTESRRKRLTWAAASILMLVCIAGTLWMLKGDTESKRAKLAVDLLSAWPLASDSRLEHDARFDTSGRVVYIRTDRTAGSSELVVLDPVSLAERVLWTQQGSLRHPAPSPDGREIAVVLWASKSCQLWSVSIVDARRSRIGDCSGSASGGLEWTRDGNALLYTGAALDDQHAPGLMMLDRSNNEHRRLTSPMASEGAHVDPKLSADGKFLVYASKNGNEGQLWRTDWPLQTQRHTLLKRPEPIYGHAFEPQGDALWIAGDLTLYRALHRLHGDGKPELIGGRGARSIDLSGTGAAVWSEAIYDADIWLRPNKDAEWTTIAHSNRYESQPEFSADGNRLALISNRNGAESVLVYNMMDDSTRQLSLDPGFRWVRPTWTASGSALIITAYEDQQTRLYRYELDGDILSPVPHVAAGAFQGMELADRLLFLNGHGTDSSTLMQLRKGNSQPENPGLGSVATFRASSDWIALSRPGSSDLQVVRLDGLQQVREIKRDGAVANEAFALTASTLYYLDRATLWSVELPDGEAVAVPIKHLPNGSGPSLAVSSKGAIASVTTTSLSIDLMYAESTRVAH